MRKAAAPNRTPLKIALALGAVIVLLGVGQVVQSSTVSEKSRQISLLEAEIADLKGLGEKLELKLAEDQTIGSVENRAVSLGLVPSDKIDYVTPTAPVVAKR